MLEALKRKAYKTCSEWKQGGEPSKGKIKEEMEKAKLKERIGLAMLEKLKKMGTDENPPKPQGGRLYPELPKAPPPYDSPRIMAPVLDRSATVNYHKRPDDGSSGQEWCLASEGRK